MLKHLFFLFLVPSLYGAIPSFQSFNTNHFSVVGSRVTIKDGALLSNLVARGTMTAGPIVQTNSLDAPLYDGNTIGWWRSYMGATWDSTNGVSQLLDASGGHPLTNTVNAAMPVRLPASVNGRDTLFFDGSDDYLRTIDFTLNQPCTMYLLTRPITWTANDRIFAGKTDGYIYQNTAYPSYAMRTGGSVGPSRGEIGTNTIRIITMVWNGASSTLNVDGWPVQGGDPGSGNFGGITLAAGTAANFQSHQEFMEMIVRNNADTNTLTRLAIQKYLANVAGMPFRLIVCSGNSITLGSSVSDLSRYPGQVITNLWPNQQWWFYNDGVGADTTSNMILRASSTDALYDSRNATNILCAWEISNALVGGDGTNTAYSDYVSYCRARQRVGWKVLAFTVLPRNTPAPFEDYRTNINTLIRANYTAFSDGLVDVATNGNIGCPTCYTNTTYYLDGTHPTAAGYKIVADMVTNTIGRLVSPIVPSFQAVYAPTNTAGFRVATNAFVLGTRYTNGNQRAMVAASFTLTAAVAGTATVSLYVEHGTTITNSVTVSAGPMASLVVSEMLTLPVPPGGFYYFADEDSGSGASSDVVGNKCSVTYW